MVSADDTQDAEDIVAQDPGVQKLLRERYGITDMTMVAADPWYYGDRYGESHACSCSIRHPARMQIVFDMLCGLILTFESLMLPLCACSPRRRSHCCRNCAH